MTDTVLYTVRGQRDYQFLDPAHILSAFLHTTAVDYRLNAVSGRELPNPQLLAAPRYFSFNGRTLTLFPTPDREYELHFEREVELPPFAPLHSFPDGLHVRWMTVCMIGTDTLLTRFDARIGEPFVVPRSMFNHFSEREFVLALRHYRPQIEECMRRARETPGQQFSCNWHLTQHELEDACFAGTVQFYGHMHVRPEWQQYAPNGYPLAIASEANAKSIKLLKAWLTEEQRAEYEQHTHFTVIGNYTGTHYRLIAAHSYNILELDSKGEPNGNKFCVVPVQSVAMGDQLLAQKIWLETDETRTLKIANKILRQDLDGTTERARGMLGVADITRAAIQMWRRREQEQGPNRTEVFGEPDRPPQVGQQLRVRLPQVHEEN